MAVDYVKTGQPARMSRDLKWQRRPHFMDNSHISKEKTYVSRKVLGQLYDQVERVDFKPEFTYPFDKRILSAYDLDDETIQAAKEVKQEYDAHMRRIMAQHNIGTEFEIWSTFVLAHAKLSNDYKFHEQMGQISTALKDRFRQICYERAGGKAYEQIGPFVAAMYAVTANEVTAAVQECNTTITVGGQPKPMRNMTVADMPMMSFPWLFHGVLGKIAKDDQGRRASRSTLL